MKKVLMLLVLIASLSAQFTVGGTFISTDPSLIGGYVEYEAGEFGDMPYFGHVGYSTGSEKYPFFGDVTFTFIEIGSSTHYAVNDEIYGLGKVLYSIGSTDISGVPAESELTLIIGAGYKLGAIKIEAGFGLTGLDGLRINAGYSF